MNGAGATENLGDFPTAARRALAAGAALCLRIDGPTAATIVEVVDQTTSGASIVVASFSAELTTGQVADVLGVSRATVVDLVDSGKSPGYKVGLRLSAGFHGFQE